jgi:hypothetical protein
VAIDSRRINAFLVEFLIEPTGQVNVKKKNQRCCLRDMKNDDKTTQDKELKL